MNSIRKIWYDKPLTVIMLVAVASRIVATFFAKGFGMFDDHFLVIEPAAAWTEGYNYNHWLPMGNPDQVPSGHSFFYVGLHYIILSLLKGAGMTAPWAIMLVIRAIHAAWSLVIVVFGYRVAHHYGSRQAANTTGLLLALYWFIPWSSVRNLVETACIPFLILAVWLLIRNDRRPIVSAIVSGLLASLAFSTRFQTLFFSFGLGLALLLTWRWKQGLAYGIAFVGGVGLVQGGIDLYIWGRPFAELGEYIRYNQANAYTYFTGEWYNYLLLAAGIFIPPIGFFLMFGTIARFRRLLLISLPTLLFLLFHSWFPNKQERFIFPILPFLIIAGTVGWYSFSDKSNFWLHHPRLLRGCWIFFWVLNTILLLPVTTMYSKKARVVSMEYLARYQPLKCVLLEGTATNAPKQMPMFYSRQWFYQLEMNNHDNADTLSFFLARVPHVEPRFVLFFANEQMPQRIRQAKEQMPGLVYETTIEPSFIDKVLHWMNPYNANETIVVFRNTRFFPNKVSENHQP
jgi:hypothetical protein